MFQNPLPDYLPIPTSQHDPRILSPPPSHQEHPGAPQHVPLSPCLQQRLCFIYQKNTTTWNQAARDRRWGAKVENFQNCFPPVYTILIVRRKLWKNLGRVCKHAPSKGLILVTTKARDPPKQTSSAWRRPRLSTDSTDHKLFILRSLPCHYRNHFFCTKLGREAFRKHWVHVEKNWNACCET